MMMNDIINRLENLNGFSCYYIFFEEKIYNKNNIDDKIMKSCMHILILELKTQQCKKERKIVILVYNFLFILNRTVKGKFLKACTIN